jgi:hypothetical protein
VGGGPIACLLIINKRCTNENAVGVAIGTVFVLGGTKNSDLLRKRWHQPKAKALMHVIDDNTN